jgi:hypothetical protein
VDCYADWLGTQGDVLHLVIGREGSVRCPLTPFGLGLARCVQHVPHPTLSTPEEGPGNRYPAPHVPS